MVRSPRRHTSRVIAIAIVLILALPAAASAYSLFGCKFTTANIKWRDATTGGYGATAAASAAAWNATATPVNLTKVTSGQHINVYNSNFGATGYDGIVTDTLGRNPVVYSCGGGTWDTNIQAYWNTHYTNAYSTAKRQSVMVHELGHAQGLAHWSQTACSSVTIMQPDTHTRYNICGKTTPQPDDVAGVNAIY